MIHLLDKRFFGVFLGLALLLLSLSLLWKPSEASYSKIGGATAVSGTIDSDTTWTLAESPYLITRDVTVAPNVTLTIEPGVLVHARDNTHLQVQGHLQAVGTDAAPITFTSEINNDGNQWAGIYFDTGTGHLKHVVVRYGGDRYNTNIRVHTVRTDGEVRIENSLIERAGTDSDVAYPIGIDADQLHQVTLINNTFNRNFPNLIGITGGTLLGDVTLSPQTGLDGYYLDDHFTVGTDVTLTIEPGTTIKVRDARYLQVQGDLQAVGTASNPIVFTSIADTEGNQWAGLYFNEGSGHLNHTIVRYGGDRYNANIRVDAVRTDGEVRIENSLIERAGTDNDEAYPIVIGADELHQVTLINNTFNRNFPNVIWISGGTLPGNATLSPQTSLDGYYLGGDFTVGTDATLTIEPGTTIKVRDERYLQVQGNLQAVGTANNPIVFTSLADTEGNQWAGLYFNGGSGHLNHTIVRHGGDSYNANIRVDAVRTDGEVRIENSLIERAGTDNDEAYPIVIGADELHQVTLINNTFNRNFPNVIWISGGTLPGNATLPAQRGLDGYYLADHFIVGTDTTLTIEPGTTIKVRDDRYLQVQGDLQAIGTANNPIVFTSLADTEGNQWIGLYFNGGSGHLNHTIVRYGGDSYNANIRVDAVRTDGEVRIENSLIERAGADNDGAYPITIDADELHQVTLLNNTFNRNFPDLIWISGGTLPGNATLPAQTGLDGYYLADHFTVGTDATLTIEPGTTIKVRDDRYLQVQGDLQAIGTANNPIIFTSIADTEGNQWDGIYFNGGSGHLNHAIVRYGGDSFFGGSVQANIYVDAVRTDDEVRIENSQIERAGTDKDYGYGLAIDVDQLHQVTLINNSFNRNFPNRVWISGGTLASDATVSPQTGLDSYVLNDNFTVGSNATLTIEPGTTIKVLDGRYLQVQGDLQAIGTAAQPIIFTSTADTEGNQWAGLYFNGGTGHLKHAIVRYGGDPFFRGSPRANVYVPDVPSDGQVLIEHSQIQDSGWNGLVVEDKVSINCSTIANQAQSGVWLPSGGTPTLAISDTNIYENASSNGIHNQNEAQVDARNNWWGNANGPSTESGSAIFGTNVITEPVRTAEVICDSFAVAPTSFSFVADVGQNAPAAREFTVARLGSGANSWTASSDVEWLTLSSSSGSGTQVMTVSVSIDGLVAGTYEGQITVSSPGVSDSAQVVPVTLTLEEVTDGVDEFESDDICAEANSIALTGLPEAHTFHDQGDQDWAAFEVMTGTTYLVEAQTGANSFADVTLEIYSECGAGAIEEQDPSFSIDTRLSFTAPTGGTYYLRVSNHDAGVYGPDVTYNLSVRALDQEARPGAVVIVAGRLRESDPLQENIHHITNSVYRLFLDQGYSTDRIYYLATDQTLNANGGGSDVNDLATKDNLREAITQWAKNILEDGEPFTLYLADHGEIGELYLDGVTGETVTPAELDTWLDQLENETGALVNVIIEACYSGSFIKPTPSLSQPNRVVITSANSSGLAYARRSGFGGAFFSDAFIDALGRGFSLRGAFEEARRVVRLSNRPQEQEPLLDDNGDGQYTAQDGSVASLRSFAYAGSLSDDEEWAPSIVQAFGPDGPVTNRQGTIRAQVRDDEEVAQVWGTIYSPSYEPPTEQEELVVEDLPIVELSFDSHDTFEGTYNDFSESGTYRIVIYAQDNDGRLSYPTEIEVQVQVQDEAGGELYLPLVIR